MFKEILDNVLNATFKAYSSINEDDIQSDLSKINVEISRKANSGDIATNIAMIMSKHVGVDSITFAKTIIPYLEQHYGKGSCEIAGPGFINITMEPMWWLRTLYSIMKEGNDYGTTYSLSVKPKANIEYVSANPTGPLHIGHARGAIFGDVLASLYEKCGADVTREYYVNDAGGQFNTFLETIYYHCDYHDGKAVTEPENFYPGDHLKSIAYDWRVVRLGHGKKYDSFKDYIMEIVMGFIKNDLKMLGIKHDVFTYESDIVNNGGVNEALKLMRKKYLTYKGVLTPPKGKEDEDYDNRKQLLFKSSEFGDDVDRPLRKKDGSWTYFATDIAYHLDKYKRGFFNMVNVWGADHGGYVSRVKSAVSALTDDQAWLDVCLCQMVSLTDNGEKLKISKRDGNYITVKDVVDRVGKDALRFTMMTSKIDAQLDFDFQKVTEQSKNNMVYYVQYAHARAYSVLNKAPEWPEYEDVCVEILELLTDDVEMSIVKHLSTWKSVLNKAAEHKEPHRIAYYLYDLASMFHSLWNKGTQNSDLRFIIDDNEKLTMARLILVQSVAHVLKSGLDVLGVSAPKKM